MSGKAVPAEPRAGAPLPWYVYPILVRPRRILAALERAGAAGLIDRPPNPWQLCLGVLRMWHRLIFRTETVGTCRDFPVRPTWRARLLEHRAVRLPFLAAERAIAPLDFTGLASPPDRLIRHLLGAHHDGIQFVYDLEVLSIHPGKLEELHRRARDLIERDTPRSRWLRDLTVYERYHENLEAAVAAALREGVRVPPEQADDPDISFAAFLRWCAAQPPTPSATLHALKDRERGRERPERRAPLRAADLRRMTRAELSALLSSGHPIVPEDLAGSEYRGVSLALPRVVERVTWKKFAKAFYRDPETGRVRGYNLRVRQDDLEAPCTPLLRRGAPITFGRFAVAPAPEGRGVLLDYGDAERAGPLSLLRDPLVAVNQGQTDLLLGRSDLALGPLRVPTPTYFSLERTGPQRRPL